MNKTVIIKAVERDNGWTKTTRYANTKDYITPYYEPNGNIYVGLSTEDQVRLGTILRKDLNPLSDFWKEYAIVMTDKPKTLDLSNPEHELAYLFLTGGHFRIATSAGNVGNKDYIMVDENKEAELVMNKAAFTIKANTLFSKLSTENKRDILKLYPGFVNIDSVSPEVVDARLYEKLQENPAKFIEQAEDKKRDAKVLLKELVSAEILRKNKSSYYYGDDFIGHDEETAVSYIEDPTRQSLKIDLMAQLSQAKKTKVKI